MKRAFLEALGLEKEIIDSIMTENGKDVEKAKADYDDLKGQLDTAQGTITDLKKGNKDNEALQSKVTEYENTIKQLQADSAKKDFDYRLDNALKEAKPRNMKAIKALLDLEKVKLDGDNIAGLEEQLKTLRESDAYLFDTETAPPTPPALGGAKPTNNGSTPPQAGEAFNFNFTGLRGQTTN